LEQVIAGDPVVGFTPPEQASPPQSVSLQVLQAAVAEVPSNVGAPNESLPALPVLSGTAANKAAVAETFSGNSTTQVSLSGPVAIQGTISAENLNADAKPSPSDVIPPMSDARGAVGQNKPISMSAQVPYEARETESGLTDHAKGAGPTQNAAHAYAAEGALPEGGLLPSKAAPPTVAANASNGIESAARIDSIENRAYSTPPVAKAISIPISQDARQLGVVHLTQQGANLMVNVFTPDTSLARALQSQLPQLVDSLAGAGFESEFSAHGASPAGFTSQIPRTTSMEFGHYGLSHSGAESKGESDHGADKQRKQTSQQWQEWNQSEQDKSKERT